MDPITVAIVAAVAAGAAAGAGQVAEKVIVDAYEGLKALIKRKFGDDNKVSKAIDELEDNQESEGRKTIVEEEVKTIKANEDQEVLSAAQALLKAIESTSEGKQVTSKYQIDAKYAQIGVLGDQAEIKGGIHFGAKPENEEAEPENE